jgi:hypothetical protein
MAQTTNKGFVNHARREAESMKWPDRIADPDGDRERELRRSYSRTAFWRVLCLFTAAVLLSLLLVYAFGGLR